MIIPMVTEKNNGYEKSYDIYSLLLKNRIIFLNSEINSETAGLVVAQLLYLDSEDKNKNIYLYINSPGGSVHDGLQIFDTMKFIKSKVVTIGMGTCASMGAFLLAAGDKRYALPNTKIMIHQPLLSGGIHGQATDIKIIADEIIKTKNLLNKYLSEFTKQPLEVIERDVERDKYFTAEEALKYGLIDEILIPAKK